MIKEKEIYKQHPEIAETFDLAALRELADMTKRYVTKEKFGAVLKVHGDDIPDWHWSDFSCNLWSMLNELIHFGMIIQIMKDSGDDERVQEILDNNLRFDSIRNDLELRE